MRVGAVAALQHIKHAVTAARMVMHYTSHSMLAGLAASEFAISMGLSPINLSTHDSTAIHKKWCVVMGDRRMVFPRNVCICPPPVGKTAPPQGETRVPAQLSTEREPQPTPPLRAIHASS